MKLSMKKVVAGQLHYLSNEMRTEFFGSLAPLDNDERNVLYLILSNPERGYVLTMLVQENVASKTISTYDFPICTTLFDTLFSNDTYVGTITSDELADIKTMVAKALVN